ncbi:hypothetical protein C8Q79DRAFT_680196 [Trametes meyenii]|nr:hypothetical protein C8Q79DRAFT_680196 [Trametes meyenii]
MPHSTSRRTTELIANAECRVTDRSRSQSGQKPCGPMRRTSTLLLVLQSRAAATHWPGRRERLHEESQKPGRARSESEGLRSSQRDPVSFRRVGCKVQSSGAKPTPPRAPVVGDEVKEVVRCRDECGVIANGDNRARRWTRAMKLR